MQRKRNYPQGQCQKCDLFGKIIKDNLCYSCYQDRRVILVLNELIKDFKGLTPYNTQLFQLYFTYIQRYRLSYPIKNQAIHLMSLLEKDHIAHIKSWFDIYCLSDAYLAYRSQSTAKGCAFVKIGKMLQELGVLPPRDDECDRQIMIQLDHFTHPENIEAFTNSLIKIGTSKKTVIGIARNLKQYFCWAFHSRGIKRIEEASIDDIRAYIEFLSKDKTLKYRRDKYHTIKRFYDWAFYKDIIKKNPIPDLKLSREKIKINILDDHTVQKLFSFIKCPDSHPEAAFMIALVLVWGFRPIDMAQASLILSKDHFTIKLRRKELTKGKHYYNRLEILKLPINPKWFLELQKRYLCYWQNTYQKVKKTYPRTPLFLNHSLHSCNYLSSDVISSRIQKSTLLATGTPIKASILRQTCGHLYSQSGDASMLSNLGWSHQFAFHYTWLPRVLWVSN